MIESVGDFMENSMLVGESWRRRLASGLAA
jgi:hypothetical protein